MALFEQKGKVRKIEFGPANIRLTGKKEIIHLLQEIAKKFPKPHAIAIEEWLNEKVYHRNTEDPKE